jgi:hypothetical protein
MRALGAGEDMPAPLFYAQALVIGGFAAGVGLGVLSDLLWRLSSWEARRFRARLELLRQRHAPPPVQTPH